MRFLFGSFSQQLTQAIDGIETTGPFHEDAWPDIFMEIVRLLVGNMHDVRRYAASIHGAVDALGTHVALADVLALEAVRIFLPDVFAHLHGAREALTDTSGVGPSQPGIDDGRKKTIE